MIAVFWALLAAALGCAMVYRFGEITAFEPRWAAALLVFGSGTIAGIGIASCLFFICRLVVPAAPKLCLFFEAAILVWLGYDIWRRRERKAGVSSTAAAVPFTVLLALAMAVALAVATTAFANAWEANPEGNWDAWSIWNLRARFLAAAGTLPQRAWSPALSWTHPEYPLLLPGFVARCWTYAGSTADAAPIATSYMFFLALIATLTSGIAVWRSRTLGLLCGLALLGSPHFLHEVPAQYADVPLACYFAAAMVSALIDRPQLAGLFAGLAAWTKDEGLLFLVVFLAAIAVLHRTQLWRTFAGALPGAVLALFFKLALAPRLSAVLGGGAAIHPGRLGHVLGASVHEFGAMGFGWYHPVLPLIALAIGLRVEYRRDLLFTGGIVAAMLAGYVAIYLGTPNDLSWQLQTSLSRLIVQVWPAILLFAFAGLRAPESAAIVEAPAKIRKKAARR